MDSSAPIIQRILASPWLYRGLRYGLAAAFIYAGAIKLGAPREFAKVISGYGLAPEVLLPALSYALPALELAAGIGLLFDIKGSLAAIAGMTVFFMGVLTYGIRLGLDVDCGCYGAHDLEAEAYAGLKTALIRDAASCRSRTGGSLRYGTSKTPSICGSAPELCGHAVCVQQRGACGAGECG
jgi:uncharacterized membrane protein YphA (DoxX/SURF4 family)